MQVYNVIYKTKFIEIIYVYFIVVVKIYLFTAKKTCEIDHHNMKTIF